jgi:hypothetical protein
LQLVHRYAAVIALEQDMALAQGQGLLDVNLTSPPEFPPTPPELPPPPFAPMQIPAAQCAAAIKVAQVEYFKAHYCQYTAGAVFADPANLMDQSTLEEQAVRAYIQSYTGAKAAPDYPSFAAAEEAAEMLPHAVFTTPPPPPGPAAVEAQIEHPAAARAGLKAAAASSVAHAKALFGGRRRLLRKKGNAAAAKQRGPAGNVVAVAVGESTLSFALAAAKAMEDAGVPGVARLFEGSPEAYVRLEHVKRKIAQFESGRLRLMGSFVGKDRGDVDMAPPPGISEQEWLQTDFFGDAHHVAEIPDNLRLSQITADAALSGGTALVMSIDPELTAGVLEGMEASLKAANPKALILTADRLEFGQAFSQRYPYKVYALAPPDPSTGVPRMFRVDHEAWDPVMQEIRGLERVTLMAVANGDPFHAHVEAGGLAACRCTHVVECVGMTGTVPIAAPVPVAAPGDAAAAAGGNFNEWSDAQKTAAAQLIAKPNVEGMRVNGTAPCQQSASEHLKYKEYFPVGKNRKKGKKGL